MWKNHYRKELIFPKKDYLAVEKRIKELAGSNKFFGFASYAKKLIYEDLRKHGKIK